MAHYLLAEMGQQLAERWGHNGDSAEQALRQMNDDGKMKCLLAYIAQLLAAAQRAAQPTAPRAPIQVHHDCTLELSAKAVSAGVRAMYQNAAAPDVALVPWPQDECVLTVARRELGWRECRALRWAWCTYFEHQRHFSPANLASLPTSAWRRAPQTGPVTRQRLRDWCRKYGIAADIPP